jgi:hypothetical protein
LVQQPRRQPQERVQRPRHFQPRGKRKGGEVEHRK